MSMDVEYTRKERKCLIVSGGGAACGADEVLMRSAPGRKLSQARFQGPSKVLSGSRRFAESFKKLVRPARRIKAPAIAAL